MRGEFDPDVSGWLALLLILAPVFYGCYKAVTDWPVGLLGLVGIVAVYIVAGLLMTRSRTIASPSK